MDEGSPVPACAVLDGVCTAAVRVLQQAPGPPRRLHMRCGEVTVELEWDQVGHADRAGAAPAEPVEGLPAAEIEAIEESHVVRAPMVGTFYRSPAPGEPPFVREGDVVTEGQHVGIVEAMKLMNHVEADCSGVVIAVLAADATPVEYDQPLVAVAPRAQE